MGPKPFLLPGDAGTPTNAIAGDGGNRQPFTFAQRSGINKQSWAPGVLQNTAPIKSPTNHYPQVERRAPFRVV